MRTYIISEHSEIHVISIPIPQPFYHLAAKLIVVMIMIQMLLEDKSSDEVGLLVDHLLVSRAADEAPVRQV